MLEKKYRYIKINKEYYQVKQNPLILAWYLILSGRSFQLRSGKKKTRIIKCLLELILYQLHLRKHANAISVSAPGNLCLRVHRGLKIFDFRRKIVRRIIDQEIDKATVLKEINAVREAGRLNFTPNVMSWNIEEKWYEEDFISGEPCFLSDQSEEVDILKLFHKDIAPCLEQMIFLQTPVATDLREHVKKTTSIVKDQELSRSTLDPKNISTLMRYLKTTALPLIKKGTNKINLVFSHGDYSLVNILRTKNGIKVIDWEGVDYRNPLYDLYNFFFTELYYKRAKTNLVMEINEAILSMQARLYKKFPDIAESLELFASTYRRLYYIERVCMLLERELSNQLLKVVIQSIDVFERYENVVESRNPS
jgi:thiamine kinase-like enzyme